MDTIFASQAVSVTELKRNYATIIDNAGDEPVAVLNHNKPEAYLVPALYYEKLMMLLEHMEDLADIKLVEERQDGPFVEVALHDL